jgi:feruloyl esterase
VLQFLSDLTLHMRHYISTSLLLPWLRLAAFAHLPSSDALTTSTLSPGYPSSSRSNMRDSCTALASKVSQLMLNYPVSNIVNEFLPANSTFNQGTFDYTQPVTNLPELCRFGAYFNTSSNSAVKFEVWMPTQGWNGRLAFVGNGRFASCRRRAGC